MYYIITLLMDLKLVLRIEERLGRMKLKIFFFIIKNILYVKT